MRIIIATGRCRRRDDDIIIDYGTNTIWLGSTPILYTYNQHKQPTSFRVIAALLSAYPNALQTSELIAFVYRGSDGGPVDASGCVKTSIHANKQLLATLGFRSVSRYNWGTRLVCISEEELEQVA